MSITKASWTTWHPKTKQDRNAVLLELEEVLASPHFCNSKRYPALLRYVVERSLAGESDQLKERTLGMDVFHRPPDYDTHSDTVVRYTAGEVRKRLLLYYHDRGSQIQISLPAGAYAPEFLIAADDEENAHPVEPESHNPSAPLPVFLNPAPVVPAAVVRTRRSSPWMWAGVAALAVVAIVGGWRYWTVHRPSALEQFWTPLLHETKATLICSGSTVFATNYSGTKTAAPDTQYPFVSMQVASAIADTASLLQHYGATVQVQSSSATSLPDLRDRPVVLIGGYNNDWTMRLIAPLRYHFSVEPPSIVDRDHSGTVWRRDHSLPYASADDYALVIRYRDATTGSIIVVAAGLGRNGTEAAAQFVTSPAYINLLQQQVKSNLADRNVEAVLKIKVIEGKTGAPTIEAVSVW